MSVIDFDKPSVDGKTPRPASPPSRSGGLFRAFWRWHFYASAIVIPIMLLLSVTGLVMLFKWRLDPLTQPGVLTVSVPQHGGAATPSAQEAAVMALHPDATVTGVQFGGDDRTTFFTVDLPGGETRNVYVNPWTGQVTGELDPRHLLSNIATEIHGHIVFGSVSDPELFTDPVTKQPFTVGSFGDRIIEFATCWAIVMTLTGYYLYFRGRVSARRRVERAATATDRRTATTRRRHGSVGAIIGVGILLLTLSGLPWTGMWGAKVQAWATGTNFSLWGDDPGATSTLAKTVEAAGSSSVPAPWAEGAAPMPSSMPGMNHGSATPAGGVVGRISLDAVVSAAQSDGLQGPYYVAYPSEEDGVFSVLADMWHDEATPAYSDVSRERVVHVDQYSGVVAGRYSYAEYPTAAKVVSQGIALHEGQRFGTLNFVGSALFCLAMIYLCITGPVMWWRRRPHGALAAPRGRMPLKARPWLLLAVVLLGVFLPMFGASLVLVLLFDHVVVSRSPRLTAIFSRVSPGDSKAS